MSERKTFRIVETLKRKEFIQEVKSLIRTGYAMVSSGQLLNGKDKMLYYAYFLDK